MNSGQKPTERKNWATSAVGRCRPGVGRLPARTRAVVRRRNTLPSLLDAPAIGDGCQGSARRDAEGALDSRPRLRTPFPPAAQEKPEKKKRRSRAAPGLSSAQRSRSGQRSRETLLSFALRPQNWTTERQRALPSRGGAVAVAAPTRDPPAHWQPVAVSRQWSRRTGSTSLLSSRRSAR